MSKASRLKGHCNRLIAIFELPAHQRLFLWLVFSDVVQDGGMMRVFSVRWFQTFPVLLALAITCPSIAHARSTIPLSSLKDITCASAVDWASYFNGALGGACFALLIMLIALKPKDLWKSFKNRHALEYDNE